MSSVRRHLMFAATLALATVANVAPGWTQQPAKPATAAKPAAAAPARPASTTTGSVKGRVMHGSDGLPYANVTVLGTQMGTMTDESGNFLIPVVPVGTIQLKAQALGYEAQVQTVQVNAGTSSAVTFVVGESKPVKEVEEIVVTAEKRIDTKSSTTKQSISAEKLREIPVDNLSQAIATKAGIVNQGGELHFRGGRGDEVKFQFDGVEVSDPLFGQNANIANLAVAGTDILSGGFDAEYGNALSGVVSVSTKEGTDRFGGEVRWDTDRYGDPTKTFDNYDRFTFGFGGPTPIRNLTYFATYEGTFSDTYLKTTMTKPSRTLLDFIQLGNRQSNQINTNFKLAYRANPKNKITFETINNHSIDTPYNHMWSRQGFVQITYDTVRAVGQPDHYNPRYGTWSPFQVDSSYAPQNLPDHTPTIDQYYQQFTAVWTNTISDKSVMTTRLSSFTFDTRSSVGQLEPWQYSIQSPFYWTGNIQPGSENNPYYATHGDFPRYAQQVSETSTLKSDFSTRNFKQHTLKTGFEARYNRVDNLSLTLPNSESNGLPGATRSEFVNYNPEGAAYFQDRWEYEGLVLNAGVRYDMFTPGLQVQDTDLTSGKRYKQQFSPRIGIAYPISDKDVLSFHYG
ncbi:MAG: TonB-dependent receptor, partial [Candidatus Eiseniibacteriota bacterium]